MLDAVVSFNHIDVPEGGQMSSQIPHDDRGLSAIVAAVQAPSSQGIASAVEALIRDGVLTSGQRLATVRRIAEVLQVSPATVSVAWTDLRQSGWLSTDRRRGTVVMPTNLYDDRPWSQRALDEHLPDPGLLPPLDAAFAAASASRRTDHESDSMEPSLSKAISSSWPYEAAAYTVANGGYEGTLLALRAVLRPGGSVAVEQPTAPRILQTLRAVRTTVIPFAIDHDGPMPDSLQQALFRRPDAVLFQPRSQVPTGASLSDHRVTELCAVLAEAPAPVTVIEDDNIGPASGMPALSLATEHPHPHVLIRSYCKAFGIDIRRCVISGPDDVINRIDRIRSLGMAATSRMLQGALAHLISDGHTEQHLRIARRRQRDRRSALAEALHLKGIRCHNTGDGLTLWIPVHDETVAHTELKHHGITVGSGAACHIDSPDIDSPDIHADNGPHIWIGTAQLPDAPSRTAELADLLTQAAQPRGHGALETVG